MKLEGAAVLVTGASSGVGGAIVRALHGQDAHVKASGRNVAALEALRDDLGDRVDVLPAELETFQQAAALAERAGAIDVLVSCAGISPIGSLERHDGDELAHTLDLNLSTPIFLARSLLPGMKERGRGHLVFLSSVSGRSYTPGRSVYSATSFGLRGFAGCLWQDLHGTGVGVTTVLPGPIRKSADTERPEFRGDIEPERVASAVIRGIEKQRREILVAKLPLRVIVAIGSFAPG